MSVNSGLVSGDWYITLDWSVEYPSGSTAQITTRVDVVNSYANVSSGASITTTVNGSSQTQTIAPVSGAGTKRGANLTWTVPRGTSDHSVGISARATMPGAYVAAYRNGTSCSASVGISATVHNTFTYNANGGTVNGGSTWSNTKWYGSHYYIPTLTMVRSGYEFLGWAESSTATTATKHAGDEETRDQAITWYAVWKRSYIPPTIGTYTATRSNAAGTANDEGTYASVSCQWSVDTTISSDNVVSKVTAAWRKRGESTWGSEVALTAGGTTSGTATGVIGTVTDSDTGALQTGYAYDIRVTVSDSGGSSTQTTIITPTFYTIDFLSGGKGVAIGKAATDAGLDVAMDATFDGAMTHGGSHVVVADQLFYHGGGSPLPLGTGTLTFPNGRSLKDYYQIEVTLTKYANKDFNYCVSRAPVLQDYGELQARGCAVWYYMASSTTYQIDMCAWCAKGNSVYTGGYKFVNIPINGTMLTAGTDNDTGPWGIRSVIGYRWA